MKYPRPQTVRNCKDERDLVQYTDFLMSPVLHVSEQVWAQQQGPVQLKGFLKSFLGLHPWSGMVDQAQFSCPIWCGPSQGQRAFIGTALSFTARLE